MAGQIVALGGGGFWMGESPLLDEFLVSLPDSPKPKICFMGTASGDAESYVRRFYQVYGKDACTPTHFPLFSTPPRPAREHLLDQDLIYVGGGVTASMLVLWRFHGLDAILREAWAGGTILAGASAGAICWFQDGVTRSLAGGIGALGDGLGLVPLSFCPHYGDDEDRTSVYRRLVAEGSLPPGIGAPNGVGVHLSDGEIHEVVSTRPESRAYRVESRDGALLERPLPARSLL